jgi:hypothetical protein
MLMRQLAHSLAWSSIMLSQLQKLSDLLECNTQALRLAQKA